jgi:hypothetical protein
VDNDETLNAPRLDRQERPQAQPRVRRQAPQRIPEARPPLLGDWFIYLSIVVLICGVVAITALEFGQPLASPLVRLPFLLAGGLLLLLSADATLRVWRSAWAWLPVDRGRGLFRFVWSAVLGVIFLATGAGMLFLISW